MLIFKNNELECVTNIRVRYFLQQAANRLPNFTPLIYCTTNLSINSPFL